MQRHSKLVYFISVDYDVTTDATNRILTTLIPGGLIIRISSTLNHRSESPSLRFVRQNKANTTLL